MIQRTRSVRLAATALAAVAAAASLAGGSAASPRTTQPQKVYSTTVVLTNSGIAFRLTNVLRGSIVVFHLRNASATPRDFFIGGYFVHRLKPGAKKQFNVQFLFRGRYPYYSTGHPGTKFRGALEVT